MSEEKHNGERIAKRIAHAGLCSRRDAEVWIAAGRVVVNGETLDSPAFKVYPKDVIIVDGKVLQGAQETRLFLYHKPAGLVTTHKDERDRETVFDALRASEGGAALPRLVSVGRLDLNTEGLLLMTTDGGLSRYLELPATGWTRKYRVRVIGRVDARRLEALKDGITVEGVRYRSIDAKIDKNTERVTQGANTWLSMTLREGKNREIRRVMEALDLRVNRLIRVSYGPFNLGKMPAGEIIEVKPDVMKAQVSGYFKGNNG